MLPGFKFFGLEEIPTLLPDYLLAFPFYFPRGLQYDHDQGLSVLSLVSGQLLQAQSQLCDSPSGVTGSCTARDMIHSVSVPHMAT